MTLPLRLAALLQQSGQLTPTESAFVQNLLAHPDRPLSPKQAQWLANLSDKTGCKLLDLTDPREKKYKGFSKTVRTKRVSTGNKGRYR